jgi:subtilisin family serine protease
MNQAVNYATNHNVLVVCSAGNNGIDMDHAGSITSVPASSGTALSISATGPLGYAVGWPAGATNFRHPAYYTNYGNSHVSLAAPGGEDSLPGSALCSIPRCCGGPAVTTFCWVHDMVMSTVRGSGASISSYGWADGTSMAAPAVSGVAALVKQRFPGITVDQLKSHLFQTADGVGGNDPLRPYYGHGFVNARRAATEGGSAQQAATIPQREMGPAVTAAVTAASRVELVVARNGSAAPEISFTMPTSGPARVELFDVAGRKVADLFNGQANGGRTTVAWSVHLRQGAYFARLTAGSVQSARQIVLLGE